MKFTEKQIETIVRALRVAADQFVEDARSCLEASCAKQFTRQAAAARELAERIEDSWGA
jgi:hypothetical protein